MGGFVIYISLWYIYLAKGLASWKMDDFEKFQFCISAPIKELKSIQSSGWVLHKSVCEMLLDAI